MALPVSQFQNGFFDRQAVINAMDKAKRKALSKGGAYVRTTAKQSLRYGTKAAAPGSPPTVHRADGGKFTRVFKKKDGTQTNRAVSPFKELMFFAWDASSESVVIGPALFKAARVPGVPRVIELGGSGLVRTKRGLKPKRFQPHPTMQPAVEKNRAVISEAFRASM